MLGRPYRAVAVFRVEYRVIGCQPSCVKGGVPSCRRIGGARSTQTSTRSTVTPSSESGSTMWKMPPTSRLRPTGHHALDRRTRIHGSREMVPDQAGRTLSDEELAQAMESADVDGSGAVDRLEFNRFLRLKDELINATQVVTKHAIMRSCKHLLDFTTGSHQARSVCQEPYGP